MTIIGITGYAQHGKDSLAAGLVEAGYGRIGFADELKAMALDIDPMVGLEEYRLSELIAAEGWEEAKTWPEVRRFLQELGTQARNHIGPNVWVQALERKWLTSGITNLVIPDVRFPNEAAWVHKHGGYIVRIHRPDFDNGVGTDHPSESNVPNLPTDFEYVVPSGDMHLFNLIARALANGLTSVPRGPQAPTQAELEDLFR